MLFYIYTFTNEKKITTNINSITDYRNIKEITLKYDSDLRIGFNPYKIISLELNWTYCEIDELEEIINLLRYLKYLNNIYICECPNPESFYILYMNILIYKEIKKLYISPIIFTNRFSIILLFTYNIKHLKVLSINIPSRSSILLSINDSYFYIKNFYHNTSYDFSFIINGEKQEYKLINKILQSKFTYFFQSFINKIPGDIIQLILKKIKF